jgi:hypothetical protein
MGTQVAEADREIVSSSQPERGRPEKLSVDILTAKL